MPKIPVVFALLLVAPTPACGGGDPGQGSSTGPLAAPTQANPSSVEGGVADAAIVDAAPTFATSVADAGAPDSGSSFEDPTPWEGGCVSPNLMCPGAGDAGLVCVAVTSDVDNCGACGKTCAGPSATCIGGQCACSQLGFLYCSAAAGCIDTTSDVNNCGACGNACDPSQFNACVGSLCVSQ